MEKATVKAEHGRFVHDGRVGLRHRVVRLRVGLRGGVVPMVCCLVCENVRMETGGLRCKAATWELKWLRFDVDYGEFGLTWEDYAMRSRIPDALTIHDTCAAG